MRRVTLTIRARVVAIIVGVSCTGLIIGTLLMLRHQREVHRADALHTVRATALTVAEYAIGPLVFDDREGARNVLHKLSVDPRFLDASLVDKEGQRVATWSRPGRSPKPRASAFAVTSFESDQTIVARVPIKHRGEQIGTLELHAGTSALEAGLRRDGVYVLGACSLLIFLCAVLAGRLQRLITEPILALSLAMRRIRLSGELSERVEYSRDDEVGELYTGYNLMLEALRTREVERDQSVARLRALVAALPDTVFVLDETGRNIEVLASPTGSVSPRANGTAEVGSNQILPEECRNQVNQAVTRAFEKHVHEKLEYGFDSEGRELRFELHIVPLDIRTSSGERVALCVRRDVSVQRALEAQVLQSRKLEAVGQLAGGIAHDFNNLLAGIMGYAELLHRKVTTPELQRFASEIASIASRAGELTSQLLSFSRKGKAHSAPMDVHDVIERVATILRHTLDRRIELHLELRAPSPWIDGDHAQLESAILNLALNARDAMPDGGRLYLRTQGSTSTHLASLPSSEHAPIPCLQIEVQDTGTGIPKQIQDRIFEPYFTTKALGKGTGLGLSAVYGAVIAHQGSISVESSEGNGSCFRILLPALTTHSVTTPPLDTPCASQCSGHVLVVDDEPALCETAKLCLEHAGFEVTTASNGREALKVFRELRNIDAVVLDMVMPEMGGLETLHELKHLDPQVRVLVVSGYSPENAQLASTEPFLHKPYAQAELIARVAELVAQRHPQVPQARAG